jgi:hypothetical protein
MVWRHWEALLIPSSVAAALCDSLEAGVGAVARLCHVVLLEGRPRELEEGVGVSPAPVTRSTDELLRPGGAPIDAFPLLFLYPECHWGALEGSEVYKALGSLPSFFPGFGALPRAPGLRGTVIRYRFVLCRVPYVLHFWDDSGEGVLELARSVEP